MVKIVSLKIKKLHGVFDYDVKFNPDVTFLYGENGCGKTTILNIITYIITGRIYELFQYKFKEILLKYISLKTQETNIITVSYLNSNLKISFLEKYEILESQRYELMNRTSEETEEIERFYLNEYPLLGEIKKVFNYIYLPLNRNSNIFSDYSFNAHNRKFTQLQYFNRKNRYYNTIDMTLLDVEFLVRNANNKVNFILNNINEKFSDEVLKSFLDVEIISNPAQILNYMYSLTDEKIQKIQKEYTAVLKTIQKWDKETENKINTFFEALGEDISKAKLNNNIVEIELLFKLSELTKITNIISKAEKTEQSKKKTKQPIDDFVDTVNMFINNNFSKKEIYIDKDGTIFLRTYNNKKIDIHHLSSGEKQIITFFAYLIFGLENTNQSIFIVDEPELSLHLDWQRKFVKSIISVNQNVQLIFATHAPEIIGKYHEKAIKLIPNM